METAEQRTERLKHTPAGLVTPDDMPFLDPVFRAYVERYQANRAKEAACPGHEMVETSTREESNRGWHKGHCKHCGHNMTYDSGD